MDGRAANLMMAYDVDDFTGLTSATEGGAARREERVLDFEDGLDAFAAVRGGAAALYAGALPGAEVVSYDWEDGDSDSGDSDFGDSDSGESEIEDDYHDYHDSESESESFSIIDAVVRQGPELGQPAAQRGFSILDAVSAPDMSGARATTQRKFSILDAVSTSSFRPADAAAIK
jgi:hypothetical protein